MHVLSVRKKDICMCTYSTVRRVMQGKGRSYSEGDVAQGLRQRDEPLTLQ